MPTYSRSAIAKAFLHLRDQRGHDHAVKALTALLLATNLVGAGVVVVIATVVLPLPPASGRMVVATAAQRGRGCPTRRLQSKLV